MSFHPPETPTSGKHVTSFRAAAEETLVVSEQESWDNEGGHMSSLRGRVVRTPDAPQPYAVILTHHGRAETARVFDTMREAEAFIRRSAPGRSPPNPVRPRRRRRLSARDGIMRNFPCLSIHSSVTGSASQCRSP